MGERKNSEDIISPAKESDEISTAGIFQTGFLKRRLKKQIKARKPKYRSRPKSPEDIAYVLTGQRPGPQFGYRGFVSSKGLTVFFLCAFGFLISLRAVFMGPEKYQKFMASNMGAAEISSSTGYYLLLLLCIIYGICIISMLSLTQVELMAREAGATEDKVKINIDADHKPVFRVSIIFSAIMLMGVVSLPFLSPASWGNLLTWCVGLITSLIYVKTFGERLKSSKEHNDLMDQNKF